MNITEKLTESIKANRAFHSVNLLRNPEWAHTREFIHADIAVSMTHQLERIRKSLARMFNAEANEAMQAKQEAILSLRAVATPDIQSIKEQSARQTADLRNNPALARDREFVDMVLVGNLIRQIDRFRKILADLIGEEAPPKPQTSEKEPPACPFCRRHDMLEIITWNSERHDGTEYQGDAVKCCRCEAIAPVAAWAELGIITRPAAMNGGRA